MTKNVDWDLKIQNKTNRKSAHEILELITYAHKSPAGISSGTRGLHFSLSLFLNPYFVYASNEGSGESVQMHRLV